MEDNKDTSKYDISKIKVLSSNEAVRKRPGMYFGECDCRGVERLIFELAANGIDFYLANKATTVEVYVADEEIIIKDDGPGFPFEKTSSDGTPWVENYLTHLHTTPSLIGHAPHVHLIFHGVGLAAVNSGSIKFQVESWRENKLWQQVFSCGEACHQQRVINEGNGKGSVIRFKPDPEIFSDTKPRIGVVRNLLFESAHLFPGLRIKLNEEVFLSADGLKDLIHGYLQQDTISQSGELIEPFHFHGKAGDIDIQVSAAGVTENGLLQKHSWVNGVRTAEHGSHVKGLKAALSASKWKPKALLIHVIMYEAQYAGPTKDRLFVPKVEKIVKSCVID